MLPYWWIRNKETASPGTCWGPRPLISAYELQWSATLLGVVIHMCRRHDAPTQAQVRLHWTAWRSYLSSVNCRRSWVPFLLLEHRCGMACQAMLRRPRRCRCSRTGWRQTCSAAAKKFFDFNYISFPSHHLPPQNSGPCNHWRRQGGQPPNGRAKNKGTGYFYQMSNMYTCIAYLIEIRNFCSKIRGLYPRTPFKRGRGEGEERAREGRPPIHIPGYATACNSSSYCLGHSKNVYDDDDGEWSVEILRARARGVVSW